MRHGFYLFWFGECDSVFLWEYYKCICWLPEIYTMLDMYQALFAELPKLSELRTHVLTYEPHVFKTYVLSTHVLKRLKNFQNS